MSGDRTITIRHQDDRGLKTLVGVVAVVILTRLWWSGELAEWGILSFRSFRGDEAPSSISYTLVGFAANLVYGIGTVVVMFTSGVWYVIADLIAGIRLYAEERRNAKQAADAVAGEAVAQSIADQGNGTHATHEATGELDPAAVESTIKTLDGNIRSIKDEVDRNWRTIGANQESIGGLSHRIEALEEAAKKPATRTRTAAKK